VLVSFAFLILLASSILFYLYTRGFALNITAVYSDDNFAYRDVIPSHTLHTDKINTQKIERKHLSFRTRLKRLARKTICFSKSTTMYNILFDLPINVTEFNCHFL
ncbi:MAG: hypothetical protein IJC57_01480, partial [Clostridia bacterium]|nr:hypothetical protein [Clostridia bacterium]